MKAYLTIFKLKFLASIQYRKAALSGIITQVIWGFMLIVLYQLFNNNRMEQSDIATYFWLSQATVALLSLWTQDPSVYLEIERGDVQYSFVKPQDIYVQWFVSSGAYRLARTLLRAIPMIIIATLLPEPYRLHFPSRFLSLIGFLFSLFLALGIQLAVGNIIATLVLKTKQSMGVKSLFMAVYDFFDGGNIPYAYFPECLSTVLKYTFFYGIRTAPILIYLEKESIIQTLMIQSIWLVVLITIGYLFINHELKRIEVYGG